MKTSTVVILGCLVVVAFLSAGYETGLADTEVDTFSSKIGIVSVQKILQNCKASVKYRQEATAERDRIVVELQNLKTEIDTDQEGLLKLKAGTTDYMTQFKELLEKQAKLQAKQEFHKQQMALREQKLIEEIYEKIMRETAVVAQQRGLDLVFEKSPPEFPASGANELMRTIDTNKLLYSGGCIDITDEVMARIDAGN